MLTTNMSPCSLFVKTELYYIVLHIIVYVHVRLSLTTVVPGGYDKLIYSDVMLT